MGSGRGKARRQQGVSKLVPGSVEEQLEAAMQQPDDLQPAVQTAAMTTTSTDVGNLPWSNKTSLRKLGLDVGDLEEKVTQWNRDLSPRMFTVGLTETPDGEPIVGLVYQTDYRAEEEYGVRDLRKAITGDDPRNFQMTDEAKEHVAFFDGVRGMVLSTRRLPESHVKWGYEVGDPEKKIGRSFADNYESFYDSSLPYSQGVEAGRNLSWKQVTELRQIAKDLGIKPLPSRKRDLVNAISTAPNLKRENPERWPGYFHYGNEMVFRAEGDGATAKVLEKLMDAAKHGTLGIGDASGPFSSGMFFYDTRDETPGLVDQREAGFDWYDEKMTELKPVADKLKEKGHNWFFLGKPHEINGEIKYWLNGSSGPGYNKQPFGWYTLAELESEKFVADLKAKEAEKAAEKTAKK